MLIGENFLIEIKNSINNNKNIGNVDAINYISRTNDFDNYDFYVFIEKIFGVDFITIELFNILSNVASKYNKKICLIEYEARELNDKILVRFSNDYMKC